MNVYSDQSADTAHLLVTTTTILLRCLLESPDLPTKKNCAIELLQFRQRLRIARDERDWDLADFCLERCSEPIDKIATAMGVTLDSCSSSSSLRRLIPLDTQQQAPIDLDSTFSGILDEFLLPGDSWEYPFDAVWDRFT